MKMKICLPFAEEFAVLSDDGDPRLHGYHGEPNMCARKIGQTGERTNSRKTENLLREISGSEKIF